MRPVNNLVKGDPVAIAGSPNLGPDLGKKRALKETRILLPAHVFPVSTSFRLVNAGNKSIDLFSQYLSEMDLDLVHFGILFILSEQGSLPQVELGQQMEISRAAMVHHLDYLEQRALVRRIPNDLDRRANNIVLTDAGLEALMQALHLAKQMETKILTPLSVEEQTQLQDLMSRLDLSGI
jgi:DNA-binding MarR family transcriptional regulator